MPWKESVAMKERVKFLLGEGRLDFGTAALCRELGISRRVGYVWLARYREADHDVGIANERSRRPLTTPTKVPDELEDFIVAARKLYPRADRFEATSPARYARRASTFR